MATSPPIGVPVQLRPLRLRPVRDQVPALPVPLAGFANYVFRHIAGDFGGAGLAASAMVHVGGSRPHSLGSSLAQASRSGGRMTLGRQLPMIFAWLGPLVLAATLAPPVGAAEALPAHPRLLLNADGVAQLKQRIACAPWARASWEKLLAAAERSLAEPVELPPRGGNWSHNYVCPAHGARLGRGRPVGLWQWEHECPVGPHVLRGDPTKAALDFDGNAIAAVHTELAQQCVDHGLVFQVTGEVRHAQRAREILLAYADRYLDYALHDNRGQPGRGGRVASQSLSEASWLIGFTQGADLVWPSLSEEDRTAVADKVLRPALQQIILPRRLGIHNIQCRHNSAIGLVGFLLGDRALIARAIDDPVRGFRQQMAQGVLADGMWHEGSSGYHFFTLAGVWPLTEAARNCGVDLYGPQLQSMFSGPLALAMPDLVLPNFNDSDAVPLADKADLYELGFARYGDQDYIGLLAQGERRSRLALLFGAPDLPAANAAAPLGSHNLPASGYAILQQGPGREATWLCLKYGPHGGGHGHPDKGHFTLYARGQVVAPDGGTHAYASPLHATWDKTTLAHNTLVVDETSQAPATGECLTFGQAQGVDYCVVDAGPIYRKTRFVRTVALLTPNLVVFVDQVAAAAQRTLDLVYHQTGRWENLPGGQPWQPPERVGYQHLTDATVRTSGLDGLTLRTAVADDWRPTITLAGGEPTEVITAYGILHTSEDRVPLLLQRRHAQRTAFVWALALDGAASELRPTVVSDAAGQPLDAADAVLVHVSSGGQVWSLLANPQQKSIVAPLPDGSTWQTSAVFAVR